MWNETASRPEIAFSRDGAAEVEALGPVLGAYHPIVVENVARLKAISVDIGEHRPARRLDEDPAPKHCASQAPIGKGDTVGVREQEIGKRSDRFGLETGCARETPCVVGRKRFESRPAARRDLRRRSIRSEELRRVEFIEADQLRQAARHPRMTGERRVLGAGQIETRLRLRRQESHGDRSGTVGGNTEVGQSHV